MRTTLNLDPELMRQAAELTGLSEKTQLLKAGLLALISQESAKRLAKLGGTQLKLKRVPRRRKF